MIPLQDLYEWNSPVKDAARAVTRTSLRPVSFTIVTKGLPALE